MTQQTNLEDFWTTSDIEQLGMALTFAYDNCDTYAKPLNLKNRIQAWRMTLEEDFYMHEVLAAIIQHMKQSRQMPMPCDIREIITPKPRKITVSEYNAALDWQKRNNYPSISDAKILIEQFEKQEKEQRQCQNLEISQAVKNILRQSLNNSQKTLNELK